MSMLDHIGDELTELSLSELLICGMMINEEIIKRKKDIGTNQKNLFNF